ncbi:MAG: insulinase family protein [Planctomycetes bacterium]|nr:insulinase family protein [Planctomycetota bacterium]MBI3834723.1 insulinase family protein [Planctomycetota bacterium]
MKHRNYPLFALSAVLWPASLVHADATPSKGVQPRVETLDNGLKLILVERHEQPIVSACVIYDVGSVNDPRNESGIAHLFEHMLFKGSKIIGTTDFASEAPIIDEQESLRLKMNTEMDRMRLMKRRGQISDVLDPKQWTLEYTAMKKQFDELMDKDRKFIKNNELFNLYTSNGGAGLNAGTSQDFTIYFVPGLPSNKVELFFWLESDRMQNGVMREFYVERDNVREERRMRTESTPTGKLDEAFEAMFWQAHPYGVPVVGWPSEVESITAQDVRDFYKIYYAPNNARLVMVGDIDSNKVVELARQYFGRIPRGPMIPPMVITEEPKPLAERRLNGEADTNPMVSVRYLGVAIGHADEPALDVLAGLLEGKTGRLYKRLVTNEEAAIGVPRINSSSRKYAGYIDIEATVKEGHQPEQVEQMIVEEVEKLRDGEITDHELQKVKNQVLASSIQRIRSNRGLMQQLAVLDTWYDWHWINDLPEKTVQVTADDVRRVAKTYLDSKTRAVAIYRTKPGGPKDKDEDPELVALLAKMPTEAQGQIKTVLSRLRKSTDATKLQTSLQEMEKGLTAGTVPEDQKPMLTFMVKAAKARLAELESKGGSEKKESKQ